MGYTNMDALRRSLKRLKHIFHKRSLQYVISSTFTVIVAAGILIVAFIYSAQFAGFSDRMIANNNERLIDQVNLNLDNFLRNMMRISNAMNYSVIRNTDIGKDSMADDMNLLYQANSDILVSVAVFREDGSVIDAQPLFQLKPNINPQNEDWFTRAMDRVENQYFSTPHVQNLFQSKFGSYRWVVSLSRSVQITENGAAIPGVLLVDMNFSGIELLFRNVELSDNGYIYLIDKNGELIYHPRQQLLYSGLVKENNLLAKELEDGTHIDILNGVERMVTIKTVGYTGWRIVGVTPHADVAQLNYQTTRLLWMVAILFLGVLMFLNSFVSSRITTPIRLLENAVSEMEKGDMDVVFPNAGSYEMQHLSKALGQMRDEMKRLLKDIIAQQESKRKSEMDALQAQINPHFLYNTLDSIIWMVENERYDGAIKMVTALANLFRLSISKGEMIASVDSELKHIENYLQIQQMRYRDTFVYTIEAQQEALNCATIKLIVQPLVENAIYHGVKYLDGEGEISVKAYIKDGDLYIDVTDNGLGMPKEVADNLLLNAKPKAKDGIGLKNVQERINIYFGQQYGLDILSEPDVGTTARIHLPAVLADEKRTEATKL